MPHWLILTDWIIAIAIGAPSALFFIVVSAFYLLRPGDAQFAGIAGYAALFFGFLGVLFGGLFALAAWGGSRNASWALVVQVVALLAVLLLAKAVRRSIKVKQRHGREYEELKKMKQQENRPTAG